MAHALLIPLPIHGHVNPMLQLAIHLSSLKFKVTFITTTSTKPLASSALNFARGNNDPIASEATIAFESLDDSNRSSSYEFGESIQFLVSRKDELNKLVDTVARKRGPVTLIILDFLLLQPFDDLPAFKHGDSPVLRAGFWTSSAAMLHLVVNVPDLLEQGYLPVNDKNKHLLVDSSIVPGIPTELSVSSDLPDDPLDPSFKVMSSMKPVLRSVPLLLVNSFDELESSSLNALEQQGFSNVVAAGPLLQQPKAFDPALAEEMFRWLDAQERSSVLYVSFGTMLELHAEQVVEIACGLASSQTPFLWVLRGESQFGVEEILARVGDRGKIVSWSPQFQVLKHPSVGGFLTHCGWNSTLESVSSGVPMIGWATMGDQLINCKFMADVWKLGVRIGGRSSGLVLRDEVEKSIRNLMSSSEICFAAGRMREKAEEAMLMVESKLKNILQF